MAKVIAYEYRAEGIRQTITNQQQLTDAIKRTNKELRGAEKGTDEYKRLTKQQAELKVAQQDVRREAKRQERDLVIAADKGRRSWRALEAELKNAEEAFKGLSQAERQAARGQDLANKIKGLRSEIKGLREETGRTGLAGAFKEAFGAIGGIDIASFATIGGAVATVTAAADQAADFVLELTERFRVLRGEIETLTGATGPELDQFTSQIAAIADTFGESEQEITLAANTVAERLDIPFQEALSRIQEGFIAGSNANGEFLDSLREYPGFFKEAELGADALFRVINQQATEGIYSDKGVDAIKEATLRLRELPKATVSALNAIGLQAEDIRKQIAEEGVGAAIETVSQRLGELEADSPQVGQALADIFGGPGEDAGLDFILTLQDLTSSTGDLIDQTNEYQVAQQRTLDVNQRFAEVQNEVSRELTGTTTGFSNFATIIKTEALEALLFILDRFRTFFGFMAPIRDALVRLGQALGLFTDQGEVTGRAMRILNTLLEAQQFVWNLLGKAVGFAIDQIAAFVGKVVDALEFLGILDENATSAAQATQDLATQQQIAAEASAKASREEAKTTKSKKDLEEQTKKTATTLDDYRKKTNQAAVATDAFAAGSISALRKEVQDLKKDLDNLAPEQQAGALSKLLDAEKALEEAETFQKQLRERLTSGTFGEVTDLPTLQIFPDPDQVPLEALIAKIEEAKFRAIAAAREVAENDEDLANKRKLIDLQATEEILRTRLQREELNKNERLELEQDLADAQVAINAEKNRQLIEQEQERLAIVEETENRVFGLLNQALNVLTRASQTRQEAEIIALEERYAREIALAEGNTERQQQLQRDLDAEKAKVQKREFDRQKKYQTALAFVSLAQGIISILSAPTTIPDPFGTLFKVGEIAFLTATTAAQVAAINSQEAAKGLLIKLAKGNILTNKVRIPAGSKGQIVGGRFRGATHQDRSQGIAISVAGLPVLVEHGEAIDTDESGAAAIINKRSAALFSKQLAAVQGVSFPGKRRYLSDINSYRSWGIPFAQQGGILQPDILTLAATTSTQAALNGGRVTAEITDESANKIANRTANAVKQATQQGLATGLSDANRRLEREQRLQERTGI